MATELEILKFAIEKYPQRVEAAAADRLLIDSARQSAKRPAYLKLAVPDEVVKSVRGPAGSKDIVLLVKVPREIESRAESRIVLPNEVD